MLFCKAFDWTISDKSLAHVDAVALDGTRYQIKGRRFTRANKSRQLGALRELDGKHFHFLAGVLFNPDYSVNRAALIPHAVAMERSSFVKRTNSHRLLLTDDVWDALGVEDVTDRPRVVDF